MSLRVKGSTGWRGLTSLDIRDLAYRLGCHQLPERSFKFRGKPMSICARCFGGAIGHIMSSGLFVIGSLPPAWVSFVGMGIIFVDWFLQERFGIMSTNWRRLITGILGGLGVGGLFWRGVALVFSWGLARV